MLNLGTVRPGSTIRIPINTWDKDDGSSITMTSYAAADILVYKDGNTTERASTAGFTATTDFDSKTGKHVAVIDLSDNTTSGFWNAGSEYIVAIDAVTVDGVTTGGWVARFRIGYEGAALETTIATLSSQTSFTLTSGPAEDDALKGFSAIIHDIASAVQFAQVVVTAYVGSTKTVTLAAGATFTVAAGDNISFRFPMPLQPATLGRSIDLDSSGRALLQPTQAGVTIPTVTTLTNAPSDSSGVTTLLSRVPSGIFTGMTSLAQWLGLIAGKQTGNSTARTELRATGGGSGTFDETTDSQEAIRDRGDSAWTTAVITTLATAAKLKRYFQLALRKDSAIATDAATELLELNENVASGGGAYVSTTDSLEAARDNVGTAGAGLTSAPDPAGVTTLLSRLSSARAGYLDNLNVGGAVASQADITALNQSASRRIILQTVGQYERPESGSTVYTIEARTYDGDGAAVNADSDPTLTGTGATTGSLAANIGAITNPATGVYRWAYTVASGHNVEPARFDISATIGASTFTLSLFTQIVDFVSATWTTTDRSKLTSIFDKLPSKTYLTGSANSDGDVQLDEVTGALPTDAIAAASVSAAAVTKIQNGLSTAAAVATLAGYVDTEVASILAKVNNLPSDPADQSAVESAITAAQGVLAAAIAALNNLSAAQVKTQAAAVMRSDASPEPTSVPAANAPLGDKVDWMYALARNKVLQTADLQTLRNDGDTVDVATAVHSDDGTTGTREKWAS